MIPSIPFRIETLARYGAVLRRETRNASNLAQAMAILDRELGKPTTRVSTVYMALHSAGRNGGADAIDVHRIA